MLLKHLPGEALEKSSQGSFQTGGKRAECLWPVPREGHSTGGGQQSFQQVPTGWTPEPSGCEEKQGAVRGSRKAGGQQPAQQVAGVSPFIR